MLVPIYYLFLASYLVSSYFSLSCHLCFWLFWLLLFHPFHLSDLCFCLDLRLSDFYWYWDQWFGFVCICFHHLSYSLDHIWMNLIEHLVNSVFIREFGSVIVVICDTVVFKYLQPDFLVQLILLDHNLNLDCGLDYCLHLFDQICSTLLIFHHICNCEFFIFWVGLHVSLALNID